MHIRSTAINMMDQRKQWSDGTVQPGQESSSSDDDEGNDDEMATVSVSPTQRTHNDKILAENEEAFTSDRKETSIAHTAVVSTKRADVTVKVKIVHETDVITVRRKVPLNLPKEILDQLGPFHQEIKLDVEVPSDLGNRDRHRDPEDTSRSTKKTMSSS